MTATTIADAPTPPEPRLGPGPTVSHFHLDNGLEVVVIPDRRAPVVTHMVWYRNGSADDPPGKSGIAHFLEHLMFKGTERHPAGEFSQVVTELGGQENAFTSTDYTAYFQRVATEHLGTVMAYEADRMTGLALADEAVNPERDVVLEERRMRTESDPGALLGEAVQSALFTHHPYGVPIIGWMHEIEDLRREDALAYYRRFYTPSNAILVVAGDVEAEEVRRLAEATYGAIPTDGTPRRLRPREPMQRAARRVMLADPRVEQPSLQRWYLVPSYVTAAPGEAEALDLLAHLLGAPSTGRLYRRLVMERGLAAGAGAWYGGSAIDDTRLIVYAVPRPEVSLESLEAALDEVLAELAAGGVEDGELARAKTRLVADTLYAQDSQAALARMYGAALATGSTVEDVARWPADIEAVGAEAVREAAAKWLDLRRSATGLLFKEAA